MTDQSDHESRWRLVHDVVCFQIKLVWGILDLTLIQCRSRRQRSIFCWGTGDDRAGSTRAASASAASTGSTCGASQHPV